MSTTNRPGANPSTSSTTPPSTERSYFEQQREILLKEIGTSFEHVLANMNKLNRNLEAVITVGNEFAGVEALWSQFENVMGDQHTSSGGKDAKDGKNGRGGDGEGDTVDGTVDGDDGSTVLTEDETIQVGGGGGRRR